MMETIKNLAYVEGFLTALASVMQDREMTNKTPGRIASGMHIAVQKLRNVEGFIKGQDCMIDYWNEDIKAHEDEIARLKELNQNKQDEIDKLKARIEELLSKDDRKCDCYHEEDDADEEDKPHKVSMVVCLNCGKRWVAVRPLGTQLTDLECPQCHTQGAATETGEELDEVSGDADNPNR